MGVNGKPGERERVSIVHALILILGAIALSVALGSAMNDLHERAVDWDRDRGLMR